MSGRSYCGFLDGKQASDLIHVAMMNALFLNMGSSSVTNDERGAILAWAKNGCISVGMGSMFVLSSTLILHHLGSISFPDKDLSIVLSLRRTC